MFQTYEDALHWIHARLRLGIKPGLSRMQWMLERLNHPERKINVIHVGGTNGKGSTVTYLRSVLVESGYQVGTFTSPYIEQFNERISVNGQPIPDEAIIELVNKIKPLSDELEGTELGAPTEFEVITTMAFYYFAEKVQLDFVILEVGLGGRFDCTNVVDPLLSIITSIGMDHVQILGDNLSDIAFEKSGIIKENRPVFTAVKQEEAFAIIQREANKKHSHVYRLGEQFHLNHHDSLEKVEQFAFSMDDIQLKYIQIQLLGQHQTENAACAMAALLYLQKNKQIQFNESSLRKGLLDAHWPGRFEVLHENPMIIIDGAHNREGMQAFSESIQTRYPDKQIKIIFSALIDKDLSEMFTILHQLTDELYVTQFDFPRAATAQQLQAISGNHSVLVNDNWQETIDNLLKDTTENDVIAVTGSLYFISLIRPYIQSKLKTNI